MNLLLRIVGLLGASLPGDLQLCLDQDYGESTYLLANALVCSMSAVGHCGDNAACEGFFGLLKRERIYRMTHPILYTARADVFEYI